MDDDMADTKAIAAMLEWIPSWALVEICQALREAHDMNYAVVKIIIEDRHVAGLHLEKMQSFRGKINRINKESGV